MAVASVCNGCFKLVHGGTTRGYCQSCAAGREKRRWASKQHHSGPERVRMRALTAAAKADPLARCFLCGGLATQLPGIFTAAEWEADHVEAGKLGGDLQIAHKGCNAARGDKTVAEFQAYLLKKLPSWRFGF